MKRTLIAASIIAFLVTGCGGGSSSTDSSGSISSAPENPSSTPENPSSTPDISSSINIKAIDGYLSEADVYIDRNLNSISDPNELLSDKTDSNGDVSISSEDAKYPVIIRSVAGQTIDVDSAGYVTETKEMIAPAGYEVVTPFTTIAYLQGKDMAQLAIELNLSEDLIKGDYVAKNKRASRSDDEKKASKKAHLFARSLMKELKDRIKGTHDDINRQDDDSLTEKINTIKQLILELPEVPDYDLDDVVFEFDDDFEKSKKDKVHKRLKKAPTHKLLINQSFDVLYLNQNADPISKISCSEESATISKSTGDPVSSSFDMDEKGFTVDGQEYLLLYSSPELNIVEFNNELVILRNDSLNTEDQDETLNTDKTLKHKAGLQFNEYLSKSDMFIEIVDYSSEGDETSRSYNILYRGLYEDYINEKKGIKGIDESGLLTKITFQNDQEVSYEKFNFYIEDIVENSDNIDDTIAAQIVLTDSEGQQEVINILSHNSRTFFIAQVEGTNKYSLITKNIKMAKRLMGYRTDDKY